MKEEECFVKLTFPKNQLDAMRQLYNRHFSQMMPSVYNGTAAIAIWKANRPYASGKELTEGLLKQTYGFNADNARNDPLWNEFGELLQYMGETAVITKMPPGSSMRPHFDRSWRPQAIYFPIYGCDDNIISTYYDVENPVNNGHPISFDEAAVEPALSFSISDNAVLTNVHLCHGVKHNGSQERVAFGWNFHSADLSFAECTNILDRLGYIK